MCNMNLVYIITIEIWSKTRHFSFVDPLQFEIYIYFILEKQIVAGLIQDINRIDVTAI